MNASLALDYEREFINDVDNPWDFLDNIDPNENRNVPGPFFLIRNNFINDPAEVLYLNINWLLVIEHPIHGLLMPDDQSLWRNYNEQIQVVLNIVLPNNPGIHLEWLSSLLANPSNQHPWIRNTHYHLNDDLDNPWLTPQES